ncbi:MAG: hypothetical protein ACOYMN_18085 [Roseimicrobium sp.]
MVKESVATGKSGSAQRYSLMPGTFFHDSLWWWLAPLGIVILGATCWWLHQRAKILDHQELGGNLDALPEGETDPEITDAARALSDYFRNGSMEQPEDQAPPHERPRLTANPLAAIIAQTRPIPHESPLKAIREGKRTPLAPVVAETVATVTAPSAPSRESPPPAHAGRDPAVERVEHELALLQKRYQALDKEAFIYTAHNKQLEAELAALRAGQIPEAPPQTELDAVRAELAAARERLEIAQTENRLLATQAVAAKSLATELEAARQDLAAAEELLQATPQAAAAPPISPAPPEPAPDLAAFTRELEALRSENAALRTEISQLKALPAQPVPAAPAQDEDDLTEIKGIAKVIKGKLHERGVLTFRQIALWNEADVSAMSEALALKGRITRDQWQAQARKLHEAKHGETLPNSSEAT